MYRLGVDTSFYTTSIAAFDPAGRLVLDERRPVAVPAGARGARPSEVVFHHVKALAELAEAVARLPGPVAAVAASVRPRPVEGSYLPVFRVSEAWGRGMAAVARAPFTPVTHQDGHLAAGAWSAGFTPAGPFLALQLSGGTTDVLRVERSGTGFREDLLGHTLDLHGGQFIDRVGVALGLPFPAGPALEALARGGRPGALTLPVAVDGLRPSFAGPESAAQRAIRSGARPADVALAALDCLARSVARMIAAAHAETGLRDVLMVGGVSANRYLREHLAEKAGPAVRIWWPEPRYCTDNAVGVALLAMAGAESSREEGIE